MADFCAVTSLHDGMNLVAKEFVASRIDEDGVLVLSAFTGAARELSDALIVNPFSVDDIAAAMHEAIIMPAQERRRRMTRMRRVVAENSGRPIGQLRSRLPFVSALGGNHGLEIEAGRFRFVHPQAEAAAPRLGLACSALENAIGKWRGAWVEHKRLSATLHYRRVEP